ncbi:GDSL esterase/lipase At4g26790-like [Papaver somniferum]|nr:GDSL esterase/lipase At4g26790-like [Papaver somniferum]
MEEFQNFLTENASRFIKDLGSLGARKISISGSFPMGCLPIVRTLNVLVGRACLHPYNKVARDFNIKLMKLVADLRQEVDGIRVVYADAYSPVIQMIQTPSLYGFEVVKNGCCGTGTVEINQLCMLAVSLCKDPTKYMYWDAIHFTETANKLFANNILNTGLAKLI